MRIRRQDLVQILKQVHEDPGVLDEPGPVFITERFHRELVHQAGRVGQGLSADVDQIKPSKNHSSWFLSNLLKKNFEEQMTQ